ncbi:MAG TPA: CotH kinase family protein, partial [Thermoanaerobaculia bacterium]|nr:CotH kinase family protein [Thermoanaerobaculia bacterium]
MNAAASRRAAVVAAVGAAALLVALGASVGSPMAGIGGGEAPATALGSSRLRRLLVRRGLLTLLPPAPTDAASAATTRRRADAGLRTDTGCPEVRIATGAPAPASLPSSTQAAPWLAGLPEATLVSLYVDPCRLARLQGHRQARGRATEETGWVSVYAQGRLRFASAVGVRLHGGTSRVRRQPSLRLYFRDGYGAGALPAELLAADQHGALSTVILEHELLADRRGNHWPFTHGVAYDVAALLGARVPRARPVAVVVNGARPRADLLIEHVAGSLLERRFGRSDLEWMRGTPEPGTTEMARREALAGFIARQPAPLRSEWARRNFDLVELLDWTAAAVLCETVEPFQALTFRDPDGRLAEGRWSWVLWDLDRSFFAYSGPRGRPSYL